MLPLNTVEILKNLSKTDLKKLSDFAASPYFNSKKALTKLAKELEKQHPDFKPEKFEYKRIYEKIYTGEYKEQTIKNLYSEFGALLKKFIAHERLESKETDFNISLIKGLSDRKCYELSSRIISSIKEKDNFNELSEEEYYFYMYTLDFFYYDNLISSGNSDLGKQYTAFHSLVDNITAFFIFNFYFFAAQELPFTKAHNVRKDPKNMMTDFANSFDMEKFLKSGERKPAFMEIQFLSYKYQKEKMTEAAYAKIKGVVMENINELSNPFKQHTWSTLLRILIISLIPSDRKYYNEAFALSDYFVKLKLFPNEVQPFFSLSLFRDVFGTALVLKKYDWARDFIEEYSQYIPEDAKENELNYSMGRLSFQQKKFDDSLNYLSKVKFQKVDEKIVVRFYYLMNYIELKSYESAISMLNSIRQFYIESKEIPEMFAVLIENSLKFFREIIRAEENNKKLDYSVFKEAQNAGRYYQKQYILEKMEKLAK